MKKLILGAVVVALTATTAFAHDSKRKSTQHTTTITVCKPTFGVIHITGIKTSGKHAVKL